MALTVIMHIQGEDPFVAEVDEMPDPTSSFIAFSNPRKKDGKPVTYITAGARVIMFPWTRVNFVEIMPSVEERREVVDFFRES